MRGRQSLVIVVFSAACQGAPPVEAPSPSPEQPLPPPSASATPTASATTLLAEPAPSAAPLTASAPASAASAEAPPAASSTVAPKGSGPLPPYPDAWRQEAEMANRRGSCIDLFAGKCEATGPRKITVDVTLAPDGKVQRVKLISNTIRSEPAEAWKCLQGELPRWKFRPPDGVSPTVRISVAPADRC